MTPADFKVYWRCVWLAFFVMLGIWGFFHSLRVMIFAGFALASVEAGMYYDLLRDEIRRAHGSEEPR